MLLRGVLLLLIFFSATASTARFGNQHARRQMYSSAGKSNVTAHVVYNKIYQRALQISGNQTVHIEPREKVWFAVANRTLYALPLFGDWPGPFDLYTEETNVTKVRVMFDFVPSSSLFAPSDHLLLALFDLSALNYNSSLLNRYLIIRTLSIALNLSESLITIHKINGSMIKVYFSCDLHATKDLAYHIKTLINHYYSRRLQLLAAFPLPLIEISILRLSPPASTTAMPALEIKKAVLTVRTHLLANRTLSPPINNLIFLDQLYQPLVIVPLAIIVIGLIVCTIIAFCLCCNRRSSSSSTLLLPSGPSGSPNNKYLYESYSYRKHRQQQESYRKKHSIKDQKQFISKGIPVVFAEELEEKLEQSHTPLVMRIEKAPFGTEQGQNAFEKGTL